MDVDHQGAALPDTCSPPRPTLAFVLLAAVRFTLIAAITVLSVALPAIQRDPRLGMGDLALARASYGLSFSGLPLFGGTVADRRGHRKVFLLGLAGFCVATASGTVLSGVVVEVASWRWAFVMLFAVAAIALLGAHRVLPAGAVPVRVPVNPGGAALITGALTALS